jgi:hypothetical protein
VDRVTAGAGDQAAVNLAEWAAKYAAAELPVLPLHSIRDGRCTCGTDCGDNAAKHPLTVHGQNDATTDLRQVTAWWTRWPWANIGSRPRAENVVLDVDPRHAGDVHLLDLTQRHGPLPATLTARTGGGGQHIWLRYNGKARGQLCQGIDVKTSTGYLVMPPSLHISGRRYEWMAVLPIAPSPGWVGQLLDPPAPIRRDTPIDPALAGSRQAVAGLLRAVLTAPEGKRNIMLNWASYRLFEKVRDGHLTETAAEPMLLDAATDVGLPDDQSRRTIGSARRAVLG